VTGGGDFVELNAEKDEVEVKDVRVATSGQGSVHCVYFMCISCVPVSPLHVYHTEALPDVHLHLPRPNRAGSKPAGQQGTHPHTKYGDTTRRLTSALNCCMEGNPQGRERYHPRLSPTTMTRQQCTRRTLNRGTQVPELFVLSSAASYITVTSGNLP
jgi:hypothetical protein